MKNQFSLSIPSPCSEKWDNFIQTKEGGYCETCSKQVIDFTTMSEREIHSYFLNRPGKVCGRFLPNHLKTYSSITPPKTIHPGYTLFKAGIACIFLMLLHRQAPAQHLLQENQTVVIQDQSMSQDHDDESSSVNKVQGVVRDGDYGDPIPGVNVVLKGSKIGDVTDLDGRYELSVELQKGDVLVFSFIGLETIEYKIRGEHEPEINIEMTATFFMGEVAINQVYTNKTSIWRKLGNMFR